MCLLYRKSITIVHIFIIYNIIIFYINILEMVQQQCFKHWTEQWTGLLTRSRVNWSDRMDQSGHIESCHISLWKMLLCPNEDDQRHQMIKMSSPNLQIHHIASSKLCLAFASLPDRPSTTDESSHRPTACDRHCILPSPRHCRLRMEPGWDEA